MVTVAVAIQGTLKEFKLPFAVLGDNDKIYETGIEKGILPVLWGGNATIVDFERCIDPLNDQPIIYL